MRASGRYSSVEMGKEGGYVAIEKSSARHKPEELEIARIFADKGYKVVLKDESGMDEKSDGSLFNISYEQRTPTGISKTNIRSALYHRRKKVLTFKLFIKNHTKKV